MISESTFTSIFGAVPAGSTEASLVHLCREAIRRGYAIVPCHPGTKKPMCTLSSREINKADELARETARANGHRKWATVRHACGLYHAMTDTKESDRVIKRLVRDHGQINIGIELKRSRMIVVDVDTEVENAAFRESWRMETGSVPTFGFTVQSPGMMDRGGQWAHKNGGHYYFAVPEGIDMPTADGAMKDPSGWIAMWADRQVLVPPSRREEGAYVLLGDVHPVHPWLLKKILTHALERKTRAEEQAQRSAERAQGNGETASIDSWSAETSWTELLEPDGWYDTGLPDNCGCDIWTAPGVHASHKSATAHDIGCARYDDSPGHAPLHVWTDNPPEWLAGFTKTFTKIQYVANRDHQGSLWHACEALGIAHEGVAVGSPLRSLGASNETLMRIALDSSSRPPDPLPQPSETSGPALGEAPRLTPLGSSGSSASMVLPPVPPTTETGPASTDQTPPSGHLTPAQARDQAVAEELYRLEIREAARDQHRLNQLASMEDPPPLLRGDVFLAQEDEGDDWLVESVWPAEGNVFLAAQRKSGKTTLTGNLLRSFCDGDKFLDRYSVATHPQMTVIVDLEMSSRKLRTWTRDQQIRNTDRFSIEALRGSVSTFNIFDDKVRSQWARRFADVGMDVFILDCLRPLMDSFGLDENHQIGQVTVAVDELVAEAGAKNAMIVHHAGHNGERSRGDSRARDWPDAEWFLARTTEDDRSPRAFWTYGRDVDTPPEELRFNAETRRLTFTDPLVGLSQQSQSPVVRDIVALLKEQMQPLTGIQIKEALTHGRNKIDMALKQNRGSVFRFETDGSKKLWSLMEGPQNVHHTPETAPLERFVPPGSQVSET